MKAKIMALMLAVGLGVTGVAVTVQAAEENALCSDPNWYKTTTTKFDSATFGNPNGHFSTYVTVISCSYCNTEKEISRTVKYESHDYEEIFLDNGKVLLECTGCHDKFYWF